MDFKTFKEEFDRDMNKMSRRQFLDALKKAGFEFHYEIVPASIPKALINLKNFTNTYNWKKCRNLLIQFLSRKKELGILRHCKYYSEYIQLVYKKYYDMVDEIQFGEGGELSIESVKSHLRNALNTFRAEDYKSEFVAYVADSFDYSEKSGNKKYPQFS